MQGLMMDYPLTVQHAFNRAVRIFHRKEIVTRTDTGLHRYTYREWGKRTAQLAHALQDAGVKQGERIATFGWNTYRHLELDRKSTRLNSSHVRISYAVFCLKKKKSTR